MDFVGAMFDCCCYWIHLLELSWRLCVGVVCHRAFIEAVVVLMLMLLTCSVNWQLRLVTFLQSTGAVAFVWRTVHSSCVLKLIFIFIDFKKMFLSLKEVFMSVDCVVFVETRMLCLLRWNCLWQLVFFVRRESIFSVSYDIFGSGGDILKDIDVLFICLLSRQCNCICHCWCPL